jgi:type 1 glutamine amidotransferase
MSRRQFIVHSAHTMVGASAGWAAFQLGPRPDGFVRGEEETGDHAKPLKVCLVSGSLEYSSDASLAAFQAYVEKRHPIRCARAFMKTEDDLPGLENLDTCDCMLLFTRRLRISGEQLDRVKQYCQSGRAIVGVRTASHAFQNWLALDKEVFGGDYQGHYGNAAKPQIGILDQSKAHPVLEGIQPFASGGSLYKNPKVAPDVTILLTGTIPGHSEPVAWTRAHRGGRVFYTSLGHPDDFRQASFLHLLTNALFWATKRSPAGR